MNHYFGSEELLMKNLYCISCGKTLIPPFRNPGTIFIPGRKFADLSDLNRQARQWATERIIHRPVGKSGLVPSGAFEYEKGFLKQLPAYIVITSNLGFDQWTSFLKNEHLTAALIDRLTENSHVINMKNCVSLRSRFSDP